MECSYVIQPPSRIVRRHIPQRVYTYMSCDDPEIVS